MQIVEVKNNLVKVSYNTAEENLILSGFVVIKDSSQSFIGQIIHLDANHKGNFAVVKLLFTFDENGVITNYNGSIPAVKSFLDIVQPNELLELLPAPNPILLGELAQQKTQLKLDRSLLEENLLVCCEKEEDNQILIKNLAQQLVLNGKKVLIIDLKGDFDFSQNKIVAGSDFKLPLNYETINFIYEKGLEDAASETKAFIQEIFLEVQNYAKTLSEKFIPFETFKDIVDEQYQESELIELVLLKNKLLKYYEEGIFAQEKKEFDSLEISLQDSQATIFDLSAIEEAVQREMISYAYSLINQTNEGIYVICNIDNTNSDKKLLKQIFMTKRAYSTLICPYSYKYLKELKQLAKNLILFAPVQQQNDFAGYNIFLNKLNANEFIIYGKATHYIPLIVRQEEQEGKGTRGVEDLEDSYTSTHPHILSSEEDPSTFQPFDPSTELDEQIRRDVDEIYTAPKTVEEEFSTETVEDELTDEDLDFIDVSEVGRYNLAEDEIGNEAIENIGLETDFLPANNETDAEETISEQDFLNQQPQEVDEEPEEILAQEQSETFSSILNQQAQEETVLSEEEPPAVDILPINLSSTPVVPIYSAEVEPKAQSDEVEQGDAVVHPKYGKGIVEKLINYGSKTLCSINFDNVGRRLLDPNLVEIKKI